MVCVINEIIMNFQPLIIIGAPRSGTNILRDSICSIPGVGTWPCDEINYIYRHYNIREKTDEFTSAHASAKVCKYIHNQFAALSKRKKLRVVVEKTCANSLRVDFIDTIFPNAKYIFIVRNGVDVTSSAAKKWNAQLDYHYIIRKARYVPKSDIPYYGTLFFLKRIKNIVFKKRMLSSWGPRFNGMNKALKQLSQPEICALQWSKCVNSATNIFTKMKSDKYCKVKYEELVEHPERTIKEIAGFFDLNATSESVQYVSENIFSGSIGNGYRNLDSQKLSSIEPIIIDTMVAHGYQYQ